MDYLTKYLIGEFLKSEGEEDSGGVILEVLLEFCDIAEDYVFDKTVSGTVERRIAFENIEKLRDWMTAKFNGGKPYKPWED
jgi:hypothetical protein